MIKTSIIKKTARKYTFRPNDTLHVLVPSFISILCCTRRSNYVLLCTYTI